MAQIALDHVDKVYRGGLKALDDLSLAVADGEFMVLLGPAGCGKSTALRSIAGLEETNGGAVPRRGRGRHLPRQPAPLSAGLGQRVAMGRAIVRDPRAFLMDEPLSNLDAGQRVSMRAVLGQVRERLGVTTMYVTRDQAEAMALGDRVCVLLDGRTQQCGPPRRLFESPANLFVAGCIGFPAMNFAEARLVRDDGPTVTFAGHALPVPAAVLESRPGLADYLGRTVIVGIRPSAFDDAAHEGASGGDDVSGSDGAHGGASLARFPVTVTATADLGPQTHAIFPVDAPPIDHAWFAGAAARSAEEDEAVSALAGGKSLWTARVSARPAPRPGQPLELTVDTSKLHFFDPATGEAIGHLSARHEFAVSPLSSNPGQRHGDLREGRQWLIIWRSSRSPTQTRTSSGPTSPPSRPGSLPPRPSCTTCPRPTSTPPTGGCRPPRSHSAAVPAAPTPAGTSSSRPAGRCPTTLPSRTACPPAARCTSPSSAVAPTARGRRSSPCASRRGWLRSPAASPSRRLQPFAPNGPS